MRTLRTVPALLAALLASACHSADPMGPATTTRAHPEGQAQVAPPSQPSFGGNYVGSGY